MTSQGYNILFTGDVAADTSINPDTRYTSSEPQYLNVNFNSLSPDGGAFVGLDGDPNFTGALTQTINGLTIGQEYQLTFYWAGAELYNRTGYATIQLTGSFGSDTFATPVYPNANPHYPNSMNVRAPSPAGPRKSSTSPPARRARRYRFWRSGRPRPTCRRLPFWTASR